MSEEATAGQEERERHKAMIARACESYGFTIDEWDKDPDNSDRTRAHLGRWKPIEDDEDVGLYHDQDEGELTAIVVGGFEHGNERVSFALACEDREAIEIEPDNVEPA